MPELLPPSDLPATVAHERPLLEDADGALGSIAASDHEQH